MKNCRYYIVISFKIIRGNIMTYNDIIWLFVLNTLNKYFEK